MRIDLLSAVPELLAGPFDASMVRRARDKGCVEIHVHNLRDFSTDKHRKVDDAPFGGAAGMVMTIQPIADAIAALRAERDYAEVIYLSPDGEVFNQQLANRMSLGGNLILLCGHYKGVDQRVRDHLITREISIGDYVLSGGELAAAVVVDAVVRLIPGVLGDEQSALTDSFQDGLLAPPVYTRPAKYGTWEVPEVLRGGDHARIQSWEEDQALERTRARRPDLLSDSSTPGS
jgi:tRNA (guanine37-N1)-methyltransferase